MPDIAPQRPGSTNTQRAGIGNMVITLFDVRRYARQVCFGSSEISSNPPDNRPPMRTGAPHFQTADGIEGRINL